PWCTWLLSLSKPLPFWYSDDAGLCRGDGCSVPAVGALRSGSEGQRLVGVEVDVDCVAGGEFAGQQAFGERVFHQCLDRALERPGAVDRVETGFSELVQCRFANLQFKIVLGQP